jgi:DNA-binding response OmpR family regulator
LGGQSLKGKKILVIDDDPSIGDLIKALLSRAGAQVWVAYDGAGGMSELHAHSPDLVLLDIMMPGDDGVQILRQIREISDVAVIMLTALASDGKAVSCLDLGADDYVTKPFYPSLLEARVNAVLRRSATQTPSSSDESFYEDGNLKIDVPAHLVLVRGSQVRLTGTEFRLLAYLGQKANKVCYFNEILEDVWGKEYRGNAEYVHTYIWQLRQKLEKDPKNPEYLLGVRGIGYYFQSQH